PSLDGDGHVWIEWLHRTVAAVIGFLILGLAVVAWLDHRDRRSILWPSFAAVLLVGFQAWLGGRSVQLGNTGASVTAHLAAAGADIFINSGGLVTHALHRYAAAIVLLVVGASAWFAWRNRAAQPRLAQLAIAVLLAYVAQVVVGGLQVLLLLAPWTQTLHVAL